ncbi:hypothetical protein DERF_010077 [Dermatophagoides farinae]|uniref:Rho-GAP domain-containing protein n=1 Tax=Dermatophagoides farinae TaxID=6954 RepID=A0A922L4N3_DERFA|nr:hypothetical protein DERF_010077 [Dermatophagoides farinae]
MNSRFFLQTIKDDDDDDDNNKKKTLNNGETTKTNHQTDNKMATTLKSNHKCLAKLNVTIILGDDDDDDNNKIQSSRLIGLIQADYGSYGLFIWNNNNNNQNDQNENIPIETIIPIDQRFHYQLENGTDLALFITYDECSPLTTTTTTTTKTINKSMTLNLETENDKTISVKDSILLEYDPLMIVDDKIESNNDDDDDDEKIINKQSSSSSSSYRFILSYNEMTEKFISQLQHIVSVSSNGGNNDNLRSISNPSPSSSSSENKLKNSNSSNKLINLFDDMNQQQQQYENHQMKSIINNNNYIEPESPEHFGDYDTDNFLNSDFNRELQIQTATEERRNEYVRYVNYTLFIGTWNVNGQIMLNTDVMRTHFLSIDANAPDFYAIGFQELDLSKEAFLFNDNKKEDYWLQICEQSLHPERQYFLLKKIRLIGMMLIIFAAREFRQFIKNVAAETVGTGILGKMGNKGGVAIRFELHDTSICFVNCHLAAHVEQFERRNQDFREINSRLQFMNLKTPKRIYDHDQIYWFGDLNYRIMTSDTDYVKKLLNLQEFDKLLAIDQLRNQMLEKNCFQGFNESIIRHMPSYKYNTGTNEWDSSEKRRPPAWCDRILWRGENIHQTVYRSHPELKDSDHKPVSALFESQVLLIDHQLKRKVYEDVMKKLDKVENELLPQVSIDTTEINFGTVSFKDNSCRMLTLTNTGQSRIRYRFINKPNDKNFCKQWLRVTPATGMIKVKEEIIIVFELNFDDISMAYRFNYGLETLADTLVLSLIGGKDIFITISGDYRLSCFGCSLQTLVQLEQPIATMTLKEFQQKFGDHHVSKLPNYKERLIDIITESMSTMNVNDNNNDDGLPLPKELFILIDHLYRNGYVNVNIFQSSGMENEFFIIRDSLDSSDPNRIANVSEHSLAEALLLFLETLPESIIPFIFYDRVQRANKNHSECKQIYNELSEIHRSAFHYLMMFLQEMCNNSGIDKPLNKLYISKLFGPILIRRPPESFYTFNNNNSDNNQLLIDIHQSGHQQQQQLLQQPYGTIKSSSSSSSSSSSLSSTTIATAHQQMSCFSGQPMNSGSIGNNEKYKIDTLTPEQFFINYFLNLNTW